MHRFAACCISLQAGSGFHFRLRSASFGGPAAPSALLAALAECWIGLCLAPKLCAQGLAKRSSQTGCRMKSLLACVTSLFVLAMAGPAFAATINITYTAVYDRIRPQPQKNVRLNAKFEINLSESGAVSERVERSAGQAADNFKRGMKLGDGWQVVDENSLRRVINQPQSQLIIDVKVSGKTCSVDVNWNLKPGFKEYKFRRITDGSMAFFTEPKIQTTNCTIK
jgi:hypothetical protein